MRSTVVLAGLALAGCDRSALPEPAAMNTVNHVPLTQPSTPMPPPTATPVQRFQALGTEPFWSVFVLPGLLRYTTTEDVNGTHFPAQYTVEGEAQIWTGTLKETRFSLRITPGTCSDGMSDTVYAYSATLTIGTRIERGCARLN